MAKYEVLVYLAAERDLEGVVEFLSAVSPQAASKFLDLFVERVSSLTQLPERCPAVRDLALKVKGYRVLVIEDYLVFFVVRGYTVQIRRIVHGKRNYEWLL